MAMHLYFQMIIFYIFFDTMFSCSSDLLIISICLLFLKFRTFANLQNSVGITTTGNLSWSFHMGMVTKA